MKATVLALCLMYVSVVGGEGDGESSGSDEEVAVPIKCVQGDGSDMEAKVCEGDDAATKCSQPRYVEYTGMSEGVDYACGPCADDTEDTCESCLGETETACNVKKDTDDDFKCHSYEYNLTDKKFIMKEDLTICKRLEGTLIKCNMPGDFADEDYEVKKKGCGGCRYSDKAARVCAECEDRDVCNRTPVKCVQGDGSDGLGRICIPEKSQAPPTVCSKPKFLEYEGFADGTYSCGDCDTNTCEECDGNDVTACNTKITTVGRDFRCNEYKFDQDSKSYIKKNMEETEGTVTCRRLKTTPMLCNKPVANDGKKVQFLDNTRCGGCTVSGVQAEHCQQIDPVPILCLQGDGTNTEGQTCPKSGDDGVPVKCHQTKFVQYSGFAGELSYGCGGCTPDKLNTTCQECFGNTDEPCNKEIITIKPDYKCYDYEYKEKEKKFKTKDDMITCQRRENTAPKCNMPGREATSTNYLNNGCGGCTAEEKAAMTCTECGNVQCNRAFVAAFTAIFLPLILALL